MVLRITKKFGSVGVLATVFLGIGMASAAAPSARASVSPRQQQGDRVVPADQGRGRRPSRETIKSLSDLERSLSSELRRAREIGGGKAGLDRGAAAAIVAGLEFAPGESEDRSFGERLDAEIQDADDTLPKHFEPMENRWYRDPWALLPAPPYVINEPGDGFDPYRQNVLKGDFPMFGEDVFVRLTGTERIIIEGRDVPTPRGITAPDPDTASFFGDGEQLFLNSKTFISIDVFKGQEAFKPVDWRVRFTPVIDVTSLHVNELGGVNINVDDGRSRTTGDIALQEALVEIHLADLNDRFDFVSVEFGLIPFRSDFRGFVFEDVNLGVRLLGNADENKWQYNLVAFHMLEKDTNSELNTFDERDQQIVIANIIRQDLFVKGYNAQLSFHWNHDQRSAHFNVNDFLVRPQPVGFAREKAVDAYYLGWAGDGHFGRFGITHAFFQVFGEEENNAFAARDTDINAQFFALEISYDFDWFRLRLYGEYASGDDDTRDGNAEGFDAILDAPNFAGGEFSYFNRQDIRLLGVGLTGRLSPLPDLTSSKFEGQSNFVNPGLFLLGAAVNIEATPTWRFQLGFNYMRFNETDPLEIYLEVEDVDEEIGSEIYFGSLYRPLLTQNILINVGASVFFPGDGFEKIYQSNDPLFSIFLDLVITY